MSGNAPASRPRGVVLLTTTTMGTSFHSASAVRDLACSAALTVTGKPSQAVGTLIEYTVAFAALSPRTVHKAVLTPDPFPPKPFPLG